MVEENKKSSNANVGCAVAVSVISNLILTINAVVALKGFWLCTGAFLAFMIGGTIAGVIGLGIGQAIAKAKDENSIGILIGFSVMGALIASIVADIGIGRLLFGIDFLKLMSR